MPVSPGFREAITIIETSADMVSLENLNAQGTFEVRCVIHQHFAQSLPVARGAKKQSAYLRVNQGNEADRFLCLLQNPCFCVGEVEIAKVFIFLRHEAVTQKRMGKHAS